MKADIRVAVSGEDLQKRLRLASGLLQAHKIEGRVRAWDGTRCDCAIVTGDDLYGERVKAYATRKQIPVLTITQANNKFDPVARTIGENAPLNLYARALVELLRPEKPVDTRPWAVSAKVSRSGLVALAEAVSDTETDLTASIDGVEIQILPSSGHVAARCQADLLQAKARLGSPGWQIGNGDTRASDNGYVENLDIFMIRAGINYGPELPAFPAERYGLACWPDLGSAPDLVEPLRVASLIAKGHRDLQEIAELAGIGLEQVSGILWGFRAASLLVSDQRAGVRPSSQATTSARAPSGNLFRKLASKFGLFQKAA